MTQDLIKTIKEKLPSMSKSHKLLANYIIQHPDSAAYLTATKLGAETGISESTVVRFAIELGFRGYPDMQKAVLDLIRTNMTSVQRVAAASGIMEGSDVLSKVMTKDMEKIKHTLDEVSRRDFEKSVDMLVGAKNIYIIGARSASMIAGFLAYYLDIALKNVTLLNISSSSEMFERLVRIGEDDVLVGISFPRYSRRTKNAIDYAGKKGAKIIALTDSWSAPIAENADCTLLAKSDMASFVDSLVAPLSIINALIVAVSMIKKEELSETLRELEEVWDEYEVYEKISNN